MVTDEQVKLLMRLARAGKTEAVVAAESGMIEGTARKWRWSGRLPREARVEQTWRTREDSFSQVWPEMRDMLAANPGLQAKALFEDLQRRYPGRFADGQPRTLQRQVKAGRATEGPGREVFFPEEHEPGVRCESDFCHLTKIGIAIEGQAFAHLLYHFVLPYSNWEAGRICYSESFESLCERLEKALFTLGGVPAKDRTDGLSAAVQPPDSPEEFTRQY